MISNRTWASAGRGARKPYEPPVLRRGPKIGQVAAATSQKNVAPCWVARAAFGADDIRWMVFRAWLLDDAPAWLRALYLRHGRRVAGWIEPRPALRAAVRRAMQVAVRRKLAG